MEGVEEQGERGWEGVGGGRGWGVGGGGWVGRLHLAVD